LGKAEYFFREHTKFVRDGRLKLDQGAREADGEEDFI